jgi:hypothetical protein
LHAKTQYPLAGKHVATPCEACHDNALPPARRFRKLAFDDCTDCHADVHKGEFKGRDQGACEPCHAVTGFSPTLFGVEAHATTRFELAGAHESAPCGTCHAGASPRLDWRQPKRACADCHENPHGAQFRGRKAGGACESCHGIDAFRPAARFDHDRDASFALRGAHANVACERCHKTVKDRVAYKGVSTRCEDCHAS